MSYNIQFSPEAQSDLLEIYDYIAGQAGAARAFAYVERVEHYCRRFATFPERGAVRDDIRRGLRVIGFERRATIAFHVGAEDVTILRVLYAGRDLMGAVPPDQ